MKRLLVAVLAARAVSGTPVAAAEESPAALLWTYEYLLATANTERELAPVASRLVEDERVFGELPEHALADFAAEVLLARVDDPALASPNKIRLIQILGARSRRYGTVLTRVMEQARDPEVARSARAVNLRPLRRGDGTYVPGTVDVRGFLAATEAAALAAQPTTAQGEHLVRFRGGTIGELFDWAGRPHHASSLQTRFSDGLIDVKIQRIAFYYRGLGRVVYGFNRLLHEWKFLAVYADPLAFEEEFPYRARAHELGLPDAGTLELAQLVNGSPLAQKRVLELNVQREAHALEFLDTAAELLATRFASATDAASVDVHGWICRLLTQRGGARYAALLRRVAAESTDRNLRRLASLDIATTPAVPTESYRTGAISLDAQRRRYPSPYPESTYLGTPE